MNLTAIESICNQENYNRRRSLRTGYGLGYSTSSSCVDPSVMSRKQKKEIEVGFY